MNENFIEEIIRKKSKCIFISPHLDDAVFSAGGIMRILSKSKVKLKVVTIFSAHGNSKNTISSKRYLKQIGFRDAEKLYRRRRAEDRDALKEYPAQAVNLGFVDALWRTLPVKNTIRKFASSIIPEFSRVYPVYRKHIVSGRISPADETMVNAVSQRIRRIIGKDKNTILFVPVGIGGHVDHAIARKAAESAVHPDSIVYWSDFPYDSRTGRTAASKLLHGLKTVTVKIDAGKKEDVCRIYTTQFEAVVGRDGAVQDHETYYMYTEHAGDTAHDKQSLTVADHIQAFAFSPKTYIYNTLYKDRKPVPYIPFQKSTYVKAQELARRIRKEIPSSYPQLIGSTALKIGGQGDIDMLVPCRKKDMSTYQAKLEKLLGRPAHTTSVMVQWKTTYLKTVVELDLIDRESSRYDSQIKLTQMMIRSHEARSKYEEFKKRHADSSGYVREIKRIIFMRNIKREFRSWYALPEKIRDYTYVEPIEPRHDSPYVVGLYKNSRGSKAVLKLWEGKRRNLYYKWLKNEVNAYGVVAKNISVRFPELLAYDEDKRSAYILLEYVPGMSVGSYSTSEKAEALIKAMGEIHSMKIESKNSLIKRGPLYWVALIPYVGLRSLVANPRHAVVIMRALLRALRTAPSLLLRKNRSFLHRDFNEDNLRKNRNDLYVIDLQLACIGDPLLDYAVTYLKFLKDAEFTEKFIASKAVGKILGDARAQAAFIGYVTIISLYDLCLSDGNRHESLQSLRQPPAFSTDRKKGAGRFGKALLVMAAVLFTAGILVLSLRGMWGVPSDTELNSESWMQEGPFELSPERGRYALTYSIVENKTVFFSLPLARFTTPDLGYIDGRYVSLFAPGVSYITSVGYLIGEKAGAAQVGTFAVVALFALMNTILIVLITRRLGVSLLASIVGGLIFIFGTPAYAYAVNLYQHHISTFLILAAVYAALSRRKWLSLTVIWFLCAMSIPVDYPNLFLMAPIGIYALAGIIEVAAGREFTFSLRLPRILTFASMIVPVTFFLWFNSVSYGDPLQFSGTVSSVARIDQEGKPAPPEQKTTENVDNYLNPETQEKSSLGFFEPRDLVNGLNTLLISKDRGVLVFTPVIMLGILGAFSLYRKKPSVTVLLVSIVTVNILLYGMWGDPWGGWAFGSRYLIPAYGVLAVLLAYALETWRKNIAVLAVFTVLAGYSIYVNTAGAITTSAIPPQVQVLELEALSGRVERYSWDRSVEMLRAGRSKSFVYNSWLENTITPWEYFAILTGMTASVILILTTALYIRKGKNET